MTKQKQTAIEVMRKELDELEQILVPSVKSESDALDSSLIIKKLEKKKEELSELRKKLTKPINDEFRPIEKRIESLVSDLKSERDRFIAERMKSAQIEAGEIVGGNTKYFQTRNHDEATPVSVVPVVTDPKRIDYSDGSKIVVVEDFDVEIECEWYVHEFLFKYYPSVLDIKMGKLKKLINDGVNVPYIKKIPKYQTRFYGGGE